MIRLPKPLQTTLVVMAALATGYGAAIWHSQSVVPPVEAADTKPAVDVVHSLLDEVAERVRSEYVDNVVPTKLEEAAIVGMVSSLDPHSALLDADAYDEMHQHRGQLHGSRHRDCRGPGSHRGRDAHWGSPAATAGVRSAT
jgi:C-terminal processing protease CtpA/Prc